MLDVRKLRLLRELAHRGTIAAVADALAYTPSAVSQQLAALERETGVRLLERSGRRVVLTPAGTLLAEHAETVLAVLERASAALAATRSGLAGPLRIGAFPSAVRTILPPALVALGRDHPGLELMVTELDPAAAPAALRDGTLDVALVHDYDYVPIEPDPALDTEPLIEETIYLASSAGTPGAAVDPLTGPIGGHRETSWIVGSPDTLCHLMTVRACQAAGFTPRVRHRADDFAAVLALVAAGQGVALVPRLGAVDPPPNVVLTALPTRRRTRLAYRRGRRDHPAVTAWITALRTSAAAYAS
ncbi:LysR family transcriptional regulator [Microtetraspora sp. NBRC 13810]|uniref:LysR family transcriptional regulator n=1 Tax=Microtetraspora sp. NBRC 13810 TaxID=3030990 RepID=UPI0024A06955|nr:LysR family transcriptional regulator [Microtetraspora sp. NBRC 13810]GLW09775.1 LysR family transcriptional regulator [Microtetraspora sp. NBRC 13810]